MSIRFNCEVCGKTLSVKEKNAGRVAPCPNCETPVLVPIESIPPVNSDKQPPPKDPPPAAKKESVKAGPPPVAGKPPAVGVAPRRRSSASGARLAAAQRAKSNKMPLLIVGGSLVGILCIVLVFVIVKSGQDKIDRLDKRLKDASRQQLVEVSFGNLKKKVPQDKVDATLQELKAQWESSQAEKKKFADAKRKAEKKPAPVSAPPPVAKKPTNVVTPAPVTTTIIKPEIDDALHATASPVKTGPAAPAKPVPADALNALEK